jgi:hypothetical protein
LAPDIVRKKVDGSGKAGLKLIVSSPFPARHSPGSEPDVVSVLAAITASRREHKPSSDMVSLVVVTVIVEAANTEVKMTNNPSINAKAKTADRIILRIKNHLKRNNWLTFKQRATPAMPVNFKDSLLRNQNYGFKTVILVPSLSPS